METNVNDYYGWYPYWDTGFMMDGYGYGGGAIAAPPAEDIAAAQRSSRRAENIAAAQRSNDDPHLRSIEAVTGYHIHASDGEIGHVKDFLVEDADWSVHYLVVDTKNWWPGKNVLISPRSTREIDWADKLVHLNVDRERVKESPTYDASTTVDGDYERHFRSHYGDVRPSDRP
jgi:hypothetical protein